MLVDLGNCLHHLAGEVQTIEKSKTPPSIIGFRVFDCTWDNTKFLEVETKDKVYSALLLEKDGVLTQVAPFKSAKKEVFKK